MGEEIGPRVHPSARQNWCKPGNLARAASGRNLSMKSIYFNVLLKYALPSLGAQAWVCHSCCLAGSCQGYGLNCHCMPPPSNTSISVIQTSFLINYKTGRKSWLTKPCTLCRLHRHEHFPAKNGGDILDLRPSPPDPPGYAPDEVPDQHCWSGKPGGASLRSPFWELSCLFSGPTPWALPSTN
eukprot:1150799-Pelagomonas_calceolata.AAC.2